MTCIRVNLKELAVLNVYIFMAKFPAAAEFFTSLDSPRCTYFALATLVFGYLSENHIMGHIKNCMENTTFKQLHKLCRFFAALVAHV